MGEFNEGLFGTTRYLCTKLFLMLQLVYVFDPLCGWCFGNGPQMAQVEHIFKNQIQIEVISGGMVMQQHAQPMAALRGFFSQAIPRMEETTGVKIEQPYYDQILSQDDLALNSEVPSMAFNALKPYVDSQVRLASQIQELLYVKGFNTNQWESYTMLFDQYHPEKSAAIANVKADVHNRELTYDGFKQSQAMGVTGFPALFVKHQEQYFKLSNGYLPAASLVSHLKKILIELAG